MTVLLDPLCHETIALFEYIPDFSGKRVLEIGSGDGRLTWRYADQDAFVVGIEPKAEKIAIAQQNTPSELVGRVEFHATNLEEYTTSAVADPAQRFDLVILSWSL